MRSSWSIVSVSVLGVLCFLFLVGKVNSAVISIDFSSEWIKVALVKVEFNEWAGKTNKSLDAFCIFVQPGVPMEIVLNK